MALAWANGAATQECAALAVVSELPTQECAALALVWAPPTGAGRCAGCAGGRAGLAALGVFLFNAKEPKGRPKHAKPNPMPSFAFKAGTPPTENLTTGPGPAAQRNAYAALPLSRYTYARISATAWKCSAEICRPTGACA